jgi:hypothetical protein
VTQANRIDGVTRWHCGYWLAGYAAIQTFVTSRGFGLISFNTSLTMPGQRTGSDQ